MTIYLHDWARPDWKGRDARAALISNFEISESDLDGCEILLASYGEDGGWDGVAFVLFRRDGTLYEVNGSHCSCYGLEGQWEPEETSIAALIERLGAGYFGRDIGSPFADELRALLDTLTDMPR